jgi:hypothetical protein
LNDSKKIKKGEISLENKRVLFYLNDKYSIHWLNSTTSTTASDPSGSSDDSPSFLSPGGRESFIIEIVYLKSVTDSSRSNMILLTYNYQLGKEWAEALTYAAASATKFQTKRAATAAAVVPSSSSALNQVDFNELRDEMRDSLASFHGLLSSSASLSSPSQRRPLPLIADGSGESLLHKKRKGLLKSKIQPHSSSPEEPSLGLSARFWAAVWSRDLPALFALTLELFDAAVVSTLSNVYHDLTLNHHLIVFPLLIFLFPQRSQIPLLLLFVYALLYSDHLASLLRYHHNRRHGDKTH